MAQFANALKADTNDPSELCLAWLAGLLEAEGTFLCPPPSMPNCPIVSCRMTDRDIVERVGSLFGTKVMAIDKGKYRTEYAATLKGSSATALMAELKSLMGTRRRNAIDAALRRYHPPVRKLDFEMAEEIRLRFAQGESVSSLARAYEVARQTIYPILKRRIYGAAPPQPWRISAQSQPRVDTPPWMSMQELHWLAGWLEGEGGFMAPPPSDPRRPRISAQAKDQDVVAEVCRLFRIKPVYERPRKAQWSPIWRALLQGHRALTLMLALEPLMGARRERQIENAIAAATRATAQHRH